MSKVIILLFFLLQESPMSGAVPKPKACNCYKCRGKRGLEPLKITAARPERRKDGHFAGCIHRHPGYCHCRRNGMTEFEIMHF